MNANQSDLERLKTLYSISKKLSVFSKVEDSFPEILECAAESFPLVSAVLIEHWEDTPQTVIWAFAEGVSELAISNAINNAKAEYSYFAGATTQETSDFKDSRASEKKLIHNDKALRINQTESGYYITVPLIIDNLPPLGALQLEGSSTLDEKDLDFVVALANLVSVALDRYYKTKRDQSNRESQARANLNILYHAQDKVLDLESEREQREAFVSLLTHDMRTPLSIALGYAQLILRRPEDYESHKKSAELIITHVNRAGKMITDLLDANRIRSGQSIQIHKEIVEIADLIKNTIDDLSIIHDNRFVFHSPESKTDCYLDPKNIRRIIENLCSNAVKYGSHVEPVTIELEVNSKEIKLSVCNKGSLISPEDQKTLFQQFRRTESAEKSQVKGWGIGLTLVRGVAEAHGGHVSVSSDPEKGTIFSVIIPNEK